MFCRAAYITALLVAAAVAIESYKRESPQPEGGQWIDRIATAAGVLGDIIGFVDDCKYSCENGLKKLSNPHYLPTPNGCGNKDYPLEALKDYPGITQCCNEHDICYDTCNNDKADCDRLFKQCLDSYCIDNGSEKGCARFSKLAYGAVGVFSCRAYMDAQSAACSCK